MNEPTACCKTLVTDQLTCPGQGEGLPAFSGSDELDDFEGVLGHQRAMAALEFGLRMSPCGYNIFVSGEVGTGRTSLTRSRTEAHAKNQRPADDWVYLPNFADPKNPRALRLPAGRGRRLVSGIEEFIDQVLTVFLITVENPPYQRLRSGVERGLNSRYEEAIGGIAEQANAAGIALVRDGESISFSPMLGDSPATEEEFASFSEQDRERFHTHATILEQSLAEALVELPKWRRETGERLQQLNRNTVDETVTPLLEPLFKEFAESSGSMQYLKEMYGSLQQLLADSLLADSTTEVHETSIRRGSLMNDYVPRLLVDNHGIEGCPVIYESNPTARTLFGYVDYVAEQGSVVTRHGLISPGSLHLANGGALILEADKLLAESHLWSGLKRTLKNGYVRIEGNLPDTGLPTPISLRPQDISVDVKVILIGDRSLYYVLQDLDVEFTELFRVYCDFDEHFPRTRSSEVALVSLIGTLARRAQLAPFSRDVGLRLIEHSCRLAEDQTLLSSRLGDLLALVSESDHYRQSEGAGARIEHRHIEAAIANRKLRSSRLQESYLKEILNGSLLLETEGSAIGRVNGLTVIDIGDSRFGNPARISATVFPGSRGVVDIEREAELGESIHSKGVMILTGYLGHRYGRGLRMAFSANLALEQSYGHVDGDSAALAELCALLSALAEVSLDQSLAVTGSINQHGEVQAVGGVNEKIEGFFDLCEARGLRGIQGVIIPRANIRNLTLDIRVRNAVEQNRFRIWAVSSVDEAMTLLTELDSRKVEKKVALGLRRLARLSEPSTL